MIVRYTRPKMGEIWTDENKFKKWLEVELAVLAAKAELGMIPFKIVEGIKAKACFSIERIEEIEQTTQHDMLAFVRNVTEFLSEEEKPYFHAGLTSYDVEDTAMGIILRDSVNILLGDVEYLLSVLYIQARAHKDTFQIGRTHGVHAEPITFGLKLLNWHDEMNRHRERLMQLKDVVGAGKISGAVGNYANIDPRIEEIVCQKLSLTPVKISTQIISRDRHAEYVSTLALIGGSLAKFAMAIRLLAQTEIKEVEEPFKKGQKGSSAMPHKRNPIKCENICSLARVLRGYVITALENQETWNERDIANSGAERIILPDSSILLDYMLGRMAEVIEGLNIYPDRMLKNLNLTKGVIFSQAVMLALANKGIPREKAHDLVQKITQEVKEEGPDFRSLLIANEEVISLLTEQEIDECLDPKYFMKHLDEIFERFGIKKSSN